MYALWQKRLINIIDPSVSLLQLFADTQLAVVFLVMPVGLFLCEEFPRAILASEGPGLVVRHSAIRIYIE